MARNLFVYHPGTGTSIMLSDPVYLLDASKISEKQLADFDDGVATKFDAEGLGYRIDNTNMGRLFYND